MPAVKIDDVCQRMEGVEGNSNRQNDLHDRELPAPHCSKHLIQCLGSEHVILEKSEEGQIRHDTRDDGALSLDWCCSRASDDLSPDKIHHCGEEHEQNKPRFPPAVEHITSEGNPDVSPAVWQAVINQQKQRQKI